MTVPQYTVLYILLAAALLWYGPTEFAADLSVFLTGILGHPVTAWHTRMLVVIAIGGGAVIALAGWLAILLGRSRTDSPFLD